MHFKFIPSCPATDVTVAIPSAVVAAIVVAVGVVIVVATPNDVDPCTCSDGVTVFPSVSYGSVNIFVVLIISDLNNVSKAVFISSVASLDVAVLVGGVSLDSVFVDIINTASCSFVVPEDVDSVDSLVCNVVIEGKSSDVSIMGDSKVDFVDATDMAACFNVAEYFEDACLVPLVFNLTNDGNEGDVENDDSSKIDCVKLALIPV